jgi:type II secretory pathway predicted ATPase ExeA
MYETHFGLRQRPFPALADGETYYPATSHEQALAQLQQAVQDNEGFALLSGEPGTGKTVLCHCLLDRLGEAVTSAFLIHGHFPNRTGLLQALLYDFSLPFEGRGEQELRLCLTEFLLKNYEVGRRTLLVLDEAQHLSPDLLEELRLLANLEGREGRALQVVLAAQPAILRTLRRPKLAALSQRVAVWARLEPLGRHEAADYLVHQLRAVGGKPERIVSDEALEILARDTRGIPRLLNRAMHQALLLASRVGAALIDAEVALEALGMLDLPGEQEVSIEPPSLVAPSEEAETGPESYPSDGSSEPMLAGNEDAEEPQEPKSLPIQGGDGSRPSLSSPRRPA